MLPALATPLSRESPTNVAALLNVEELTTFPAPLPARVLTGCVAPVTTSMSDRSAAAVAAGTLLTLTAPLSVVFV